MKRINLPVLVTIMCLLVSLVLGLFYINQQKIKKTKTSDETKITRTDYSDIARKTLDWIDKQRNDEGWYILERGCDFEAKTCDTVWDNEEGNKDGLIATWARFNYYQQTKNPNDLEIVKSDINKFYEKYPNGVDNALWICKITYDMYSSKLFDEEINKKLEEICFNTNFQTPEEMKNYWANEKDTLSNSLSNKESWSDWDRYALFLRGFDASLGYTSDFVARYLWKQNKTSLSSVEKFLQITKDIFELKSNDAFYPRTVHYPEDVCLVGMSVLDFYNVLGNDENLSYLEQIYEENINGLEEKEFITPICGLLSKKLYLLTGDPKYLDKLEINNRVLDYYNRDNGNQSVLGDGVFFKSDNKNKHVFYKNVVENGLMVELLRN